MRERCRDEDDERVEGRVEDDKSGSKGDEGGVKSLRRFINAVFIVDCCCCCVVVGVGVVVVFIFFFPPLIPLAWLVCLHEQKIKKKVRAGCSVGNQGRGR